MSLDPGLLARFAAITGPANAFTADADVAPYVHEQRDRWTGKAALVLRPADTGEVAAIVRLAAETRTALVPQGGNTGLVGGQIPDMSGDEIVVSLTRLNRIRALDAAGFTLTAEAGVTLQAVQQAAEGALWLALDIYRKRREPIVRVGGTPVARRAIVDADQEMITIIADTLRALAPTSHIRVVENGIDLDAFRPPASAIRSPSVIFCGVLNYTPNEAGVRWFLDEVWPQVHAGRPDARFVIVESVWLCCQSSLFLHCFLSLI